MKFKHTVILRILAVFVAVALLIVPLMALAAPGDLDTSFDTDGIVTTPIGSGNDLAGAVALQSDGKIVVAGTSHNGSNNDFALVRYNTDGSLDTSFDTDGMVTTDFGSADTGSALVIQPDGKIVLVGESNSPGNFDFTVARYDTDGSLDHGFGTDGVVYTDFGFLHDRAYAVALQSDGKIVVAGYARANSTTPVNNDIAVARYNTDGSPDTNFDTDGKLTTDIGSAQDQAYGIAIQSDGKIVVVGYSKNNTVDYDFTVIRYNTDGSLDTSFDTDGIVSTAIRDKDDFAYAAALQSDGKIVVAGYGSITTAGNHDDFVVVRYNTDGSLDTSFDTDGKVVTDFGLLNDHGTSIALQSDGDIVVAGSSQNATDLDFAVVRYTTDGSLDTSFGTDGKVTTPIGSINDSASAVAIQSDGKIVLAGRSQTASDNDFALARYDSDTTVLIVDAGEDQEGDEGDEFSFSGSFGEPVSLAPQVGELIHWDFGDGSVVTGTLTPTHIYPDDGSFPVTLTVTDTLGSVGQDSLLVTVNNLAPVVDAGSDANVLVGETFTQMGSFTDPGADTWTATVDYGTGGGPASLVLLNKTFTLSHTYPTAGVYTTTVTVEDDDGGMGTDEVVVTVSEEIADLEITQSVSNDFFDNIFTIVVSNNGPDDAAGAVVSVTFPSEFSSVTWTCQGTGGATCAASGSGNTINDTLSTFPNGGVATYTVHTEVPGGAIYTNAAEVTPPSGVVDPDLSNNSSEQSTYCIILFPVMMHDMAGTP